MDYSTQFEEAFALGAMVTVNLSGTKLYIYKGVKPINVHLAAYTPTAFLSSLLLTFTISSSAFNNIGSMIYLEDSPTSAAAVATGTASWAVLVGQTTTNYIIGDVVLNGINPGFVKLPTLDIILGTSYNVSSCSWKINL